MTEVESVPKAKLDIHEEENHITNSCENAKEQVEVENHTAEREQDENLGKNTSLKEENRNDAEAPPPPKNPWKDTWRAMTRKVTSQNCPLYSLLLQTAVSESVCVFFFQRTLENQLLWKPLSEKAR